MKTDDFDYELPIDLIAQSPLAKRDESRLLHLNKETEEIKHLQFNDLIDLLNPGDALVLNDTKVIPARIIGVKEETNALIELLLLKEEDDHWEALVKPAKRIKVGTTINFANKLKAVCLEKKEEGLCLFKLVYEGILLEILEELGTMPLPPYIHEKLIDQSRYQTIYAKNLGSAAAPTAGLHFTKELIEELENKGVKIIYLTLHVGLGTFRPVVVDDVEKHQMHSEYYHLSEEAAQKINETKGRVIPVGTTTVRVLETIMNKFGEIKQDSGETDIFIYPGYEFKIVKSLITNFHLPKSTLIMLISALAGKELILASYEEAVKEKYRFFSFGDSMFIQGE